MAKVYDIEKLKNFLGEYLELKGINTEKLIRCFSKTHEDKHPSMSFYAPASICKCFACGEKYDIFKLVGEEYGISSFKDRLKKVEELYNNRKLIKNANETIYSQKIIKVELEENIEHKSYSKRNNSTPAYLIPEKIRKYENYIKKCMENLKDCDYLTKRGISKKVQEQYHIGYDPNFKNGTWKAIIIPTFYCSITARNTNDNSKDRLRKIGEHQIFNLWELKEEQNKELDFYIVEGEIDALSLSEIGKKALGLGSISNISLIISKFKEDIPNNKFYLMLDNDEQGRKAQRELYIKLKELGVNVINTNVLGKYKDPNEYLVKDRINFIKSIENLEKNNWNQRIKELESCRVTR